MRSKELKAICPVCEGALYIEVADDAEDDDTVNCVYCNSEIRTVDALAKYNRIYEKHHPEVKKYYSQEVKLPTMFAG